MATSRDDFSETVKRELAGRAGWICSFPECMQSTAGPASESSGKSIRNGIAAHITAAAPGGPRYDASLSPEARSDISNGIWMCPTHGSLIDKEHNSYTANQIRGWKINAESRAKSAMENGRGNSNLQNSSPYSQRDINILSNYCNLMSYEIITRIKNELFGSIVSHDVIVPMHYIQDWNGNPKYHFHNSSLEALRIQLTGQADRFLRHFSQQSAGHPNHYEYINVSEFSQRNPGSRAYWEEQIYETQRLARELCATAMQLLTIKESL